MQADVRRLAAARAGNPWVDPDATTEEDEVSVPDPSPPARESPRTRSTAARSPPLVVCQRSRSPLAGPSGLIRGEDPWVQIREELQSRVVRVSVERIPSDVVRRLLRGPASDPDEPETSQAGVPAELDPTRVAELIAAMDRRVAKVQAENRAVAEAMLRTLRRRRH